MTEELNNFFHILIGVVNIFCNIYVMIHFIRWVYKA